MYKFLSISTDLQCILMGLLFLTVIGSLFQTIVLFEQKRFRAYAIISLIWTLILFALLFNLYGNFTGNRNHLPLHMNIDPPVNFLVVLMFLSIVNMIVLWFNSRKKRELTNQSVKEAVDTLPLGLAYFSLDGRLKLCNRKMAVLFRELTGRALIDLGDLKAVMNGEIELSVLKSITDYENTWQFADGEIRRLIQREIQIEDGEPYTEVQWSDITNLHRKKCELDEQVRQLKENAAALRQLSDHVQEKTKEEEILAAKVQLHDQMGAGLMAVRRALKPNQTPETLKHALTILDDAVKNLRTGHHDTEKTAELENFFTNARAVGVKVTMTGEWPKDTKIKPVIVQALHECLNNAVRHADATEMHVDFRWDEKNFFVRIANNGTLPTGHIEPKGGLRHIRQNAEAHGGSLHITTEGQFAVTLDFQLEK